MTDLHIPRGEKLSLASRAWTLAGLIATSWVLLYGGWRLVRWIVHGY